MAGIGTLVLSESELQADPLQVFDILEKLGEGSYGSVHKARHKRTSVICAVKRIPIENGDYDESIKEISLMSGCDSSYIVQFYGSFLKDNELWIVMEYCGAGSVSDIMNLCDCKLSEDQVASVCCQVLKGLSYLHSIRRIHRDIKAGNILINTVGEAKLADFGVAGQLSDSMAKRQTVIGTPFWMAPEVIQEVGYGVEADIWSLGITCIEMADGRPPYHNIHPMRAIFMIPTKPPPKLEREERYSKAFRDFVARCLIKDPKNRPSAETLLEDPFIANNRGLAVLDEIVQKAIVEIGKGRLRDEFDDSDDSLLSDDSGDNFARPSTSKTKDDDSDSDNDKTMKYPQGVSRPKSRIRDKTLNKTMNKTLKKGTMISAKGFGTGKYSQATSKYQAKTIRPDVLNANRKTWMEPASDSELDLSTDSEESGTMKRNDGTAKRVSDSSDNYVPEYMKGKQPQQQSQQQQQQQQSRQQRKYRASAEYSDEDLADQAQSMGLNDSHPYSSFEDAATIRKSMFPIKSSPSQQQQQQQQQQPSHQQNQQYNQPSQQYQQQQQPLYSPEDDGQQREPFYQTIEKSRYDQQPQRPLSDDRESWSPLTDESPLEASPRSPESPMRVNYTNIADSLSTLANLPLGVDSFQMPYETDKADESETDELKELLTILEANMQKEILATVLKYQMKKAPIIEAIKAKGGNVPESSTRMPEVRLDIPSLLQ